MTNKFLRNNKLLRLLLRRIITKFMSSNIILRSMAKVAIKYENIVPHSGFFYAMDEFKRTGLVKLVDHSL